MRVIKNFVPSLIVGEFNVMMNVSKTNEQAFEALIEKALVGSIREERTANGQTDVADQSPTADKYYWGNPADMDKIRVRI